MRGDAEVEDALELLARETRGDRSLRGPKQRIHLEATIGRLVGAVREPCGRLDAAHVQVSEHAGDALDTQPSRARRSALRTLTSRSSPTTPTLRCAVTVRTSSRHSSA